MIEQLKKELEVDEGCVKKIYLDHLGYKTCAIGHLVKEGEPEWRLNVGDPISDERIAELFAADIGWTMADCKQVFSEFDDLPREVKLIIANMMFNMGLTRFSGFKHFIAAVHNNAWERAAAEMEDSRWNEQVPARSNRLIKRMKAVG